MLPRIIEDAGQARAMTPADLMELAERCHTDSCDHVRALNGALVALTTWAQDVLRRSRNLRVEPPYISGRKLADLITDANLAVSVAQGWWDQDELTTRVSLGGYAGALEAIIRSLPGGPVVNGVLMTNEAAIADLRGRFGVVADDIVPQPHGHNVPTDPLEAFGFRARHDVNEP